jgi:hypothetical protein
MGKNTASEIGCTLEIIFRRAQKNPNFFVFIGFCFLERTRERGSDSDATPPKKDKTQVY